MDDIDLTNVPEQIMAVCERAKEAAWDIQWVRTSMENEPPRLVILVPNGRDRRRLLVGLSRAERLLAFPFEQYRMLGGYSAINDSSEDYIEAYIRPSNVRFARLSIYDVPGIEILDHAATDPRTGEDSDVGEGNTESSTVWDALRTGASWRLRIEDSRYPWSIEFSEASEAFLALSLEPRGMVRDRKPPTLKIRRISAPQHDEAVQRLEDIGGAILFELDLRYGILLELNRSPARPAARSYTPERLTRAPSFPRLRYPSEALSLYWYGRSASGMPLLQFLAYYQVLEFFFPMHFRQHLLRRMRYELTDPRFDVTDDAHLARLLTTMMSSGRSGYGSEREQLKATISGCVDESTMRNFLNEDPERLRALGDKRTIKSVPTVVDDGHHGNLIDQVAERIYAIRNRVVK